MTWDAGPCLPAPEPAEPTTNQALRALLTHLEDPAPARHVSAHGFPERTAWRNRQDELAGRRRQRALWQVLGRVERAATWAAPEPPDLCATFTHTPAALAMTTLAGTITAANTALADLLGRDPATLVGSTLLEVTHPDDLADAVRLDALLPADGQASRGQRRLFRADGQVIWAALTVARLPAPGSPTHLIVHVDDITEHRRREAELHHRALHDPLTGLANRTLLRDRVTAAIAQRDRHAHPSQLFFLDLDGFKTVNDRFGHAAGDAVLVQFAARLTLLTRVGDTVARLGGDEFAVLCQGTPPCLADTIAARLRDAAAQPFLVENELTVNLSASVGTCPVHGSHPDDTLRKADEHMYQAKHRARAAPTPMA